ncbi:MAG: MlaD family protein [Bacteroidales bacterium]
MKGNFNKEAKIGILIILTMGFFIWGYSFLKGKRIFSPAHDYYVVYEKVGGLMESAPVIMSGYKIGYVDDISFMDNMEHLSVRLSVDKKFEFPKGTVARIFSSDIMGTRAVEIITGSSAEKHFPGDTLKSDFEPGLREEISLQIAPLKNQAEDMMVSMDSLLVIFHTMLDEDFRDNFAESVDNINKTVSSLQHSMYSIDTLMTTKDSRFNRVLDNLESISGNIAGSNENITTILNNFASISDSLARSELLSTVNHLNDILAETDQLMEGIGRGEGSLGKLISDDELYNNLETATRNLDLLLIDLKEHPGRYVNFSIFGRKQE